MSLFLVICKALQIVGVKPIIILIPYMTLYNHPVHINIAQFLNEMAANLCKDSLLKFDHHWPMAMQPDGVSLHWDYKWTYIKYQWLCTGKWNAFASHHIVSMSINLT